MLSETERSEKVKVPGAEPGSGYLKRLGSRAGVYIIVLVLVLIGSLTSKNFATFGNALTVLQSIAILGIVSVGVAFVTYSGNFADLSVPSVMALSGIASVGTIQYGLIISLASGLLCGVLIGLVNGFTVGKFGANPIIWTLALNYVFIGLMEWIWGGSMIYPNMSGAGSASWPLFKDIARANILNVVPLSIIVFLFISLIMHFLLAETRYGNELKFIGSSKSVAQFTGVNVTTVTTIAFVLSALMASLGGIFLASLSLSGMFNIGSGYDFNAVTAVVIGGVSMTGGRGSIVGVIGGTLIIGILTNIMTFMGLSVFAQQIIEGLIFVLVVTLYTLMARKRGEIDV